MSHKPCKECPFSRTCPSGHLGGAEPTVFIGQAHGPFVLSCHADSEYSQETALEKWDEITPCAGAAMYRANTDRAKLMPDGIYALEGNEELVFKSPEEFLAHHTGLNLEIAREFLEHATPDVLLRLELAKLTEKNFLK